MATPDASDGTAREDRSSRSAERVLDLLDVLQDATDSLPLHELSRRAGMHKPTALRYLATLVKRRYVERDVVSGEYRLGRAGPVPAQVFERLVRLTRPSLERIGERYPEMIALGALVHNEITCLDFVESPHALQIMGRIDGREYLHSTAIGKAIGATLPDDAVREIVASGGMPARTPRTIVDVGELLAHLDEVRACGYAIGDQENDPWERGVAVSLPTTRLFAAIGLSAPAMRFELDEVPAAAALLTEEAQRIAHAFDAVDVRRRETPADAP